MLKATHILDNYYVVSNFSNERLLRELRHDMRYTGDWKDVELAELRKRIAAGEWSLPIPNDIAMLLMEVTANG